MRRRNTRNWRGIALALGGVFAAGLLLVTVRQLQGSTRAKSRILIGRPRKEVFEAWSTLVNHPRFMRYVERVEDLGDGRSRWTARLPQRPGSCSDRGGGGAESRGSGSAGGR